MSKRTMAIFTCLEESMKIIICVCCFVASSSAVAQEWSEAQREVWEFVEEYWEASAKEDPEWADKFLHPDFQGWSSRVPMPVGKKKLQEGTSADWKETETLFYKIDPVRIIIHDGCALVHYYLQWLWGFENKDEKPTSRNVKIMATLVRDSDRWLLLGSHWANIE